MQSPQDLLLHELSDMYDAEQRIAQMLPTLASECKNQQLASAFQQHEQETRQQIQNLDQVFQLMGAQPQKTQCMAIQGLKQEHDSFLKENPSQTILAMFDIGAGSKTEYYEMASYKGLVEKCQLMGQQQCAQLLQQNLRQEEAMAQRLQQIGQQMGQQQIAQMGHMGQSQMGQQTTP